MADLQDRIRAAEQRSTLIREELIGLERGLVDEKEVARALTVFDPLWETLAPREQTRVIRLLVQRVDYDGEKGTVSVTFHPAGIKMLSREIAEVNA
jgi:site-specific DNA recombinase